MLAFPCFFFLSLPDGLLPLLALDLLASTSLGLVSECFRFHDPALLGPATTEDFFVVLARVLRIDINHKTVSKAY